MANELKGTVTTLPKMSGALPNKASPLSGNLGAKVINIGEDGATFIPDVSADGVISWTNDKDLPNPTPVNIKGEKGDKGDAGAQGEKGDKGDKGDTGAAGANGKDGANGADGKDGISPIVSVEDIDGGHRVTITDADGEKTFDVMDGKGGSGGGGAAIIDVTELPTENIDEDSFYRLLTGTLVFNQYVQNTYTCYCVETLPEVGEPATNLDQSQGNVYYNLSDGEVYGYVDDMLSMALSVPSGWYPASVLLGALGFQYNGVIFDILDDPRDNSFRLLLEYVIWQYKGKWASLKPIGKAGTGASAEVFNHPLNKATGDSSHAEGYSSHAEGGYSHAEGYSSHAVGRSQHVQGEFNVTDPEYNADTPGSRAKYAHIVGNGTSDGNRSNAHTLDWNGLGWFAGGLKVGGTGQDDPNAEEILTKSQVQAMIDAAISNLPVYNGEVEDV